MKQEAKTKIQEYLKKNDELFDLWIFHPGQPI